MQLQLQALVASEYTQSIDRVSQLSPDRFVEVDGYSNFRLWVPVDWTYSKQQINGNQVITISDTETTLLIQLSPESANLAKYSCYSNQKQGSLDPFGGGFMIYQDGEVSYFYPQSSLFTKESIEFYSILNIYNQSASDQIPTNQSFFCNETNLIKLKSTNSQEVSSITQISLTSTSAKQDKINPATAKSIFEILAFSQWQ